MGPARTGLAGRLLPPGLRFRPGAPNAVSYPLRTFDGGSVVERQVAGTRTFDINTDGLAEYGLLPDYVEQIRRTPDDQAVVDDLALTGTSAVAIRWTLAGSAHITAGRDDHAVQTLAGRTYALRFGDQITLGPEPILIEQSG
jgi:hypothetical protein